MRKFKIMKIKKEDISVGDLIISENRLFPRFVVNVDQTFIHNHPYITTIIVNDDMNYDEEDFRLCDLKPKINVCRVVNKNEQGR